MGWLKTLLLLLIGVLLLVLGALWWAAGTESGARSLLGWAGQLSDDRLKIEAVQGTLLGELQLQGVAYRQPGMQLNIGQARLRWRPLELLDLTLHIETLSVEKLRYTATADAPPPEPPADGQISLPELQLPIRILLDAVTVDDVVAVTAPDAAPIVVHSTRLVARWDADGITLKTLEVATPQADLEASGGLKPVGDYPLTLNNRIALHLKDAPKLQLAGDIAGDLKSLSIKQQVSGDIKAAVDARLDDPLDELGWRAKIRLDALEPARFSDAVSGVLSGIVDASGSLRQAKVKSQLKLRDKDKAEFNWDASLDAKADLASLAVDLKQLLVSHPDSPMRLTASGRYDDRHMVLNADWRALQWPLSGEADVRSEQGKLTVSGKPEDYQLTLAAKIGGKQIPAGDWRGSGHGDMQRLHLDKLSGDTLEGQLNLSGDVVWEPKVSWRMDTRIDNINPGVQFAEWPGQLSLRAESQGELLADGVSAKVKLERFDGRLRGLPVAGQGLIDIGPGHYRFDGLKLRSGSARLEADGTLGGKSALKWSVDIPNFADLLPDSGGSLNGNGRLEGDYMQPHIIADIAAKKLQLPDLLVGALQSKLDVDLSWKKPSRLALSGSDISAAGEHVTRLKLNADGTLEQHRATLAADHALGKLNLAAAGGYRKARWRGKVSRLDLASQDFGDWALSRPASIEAGAKQARVEDFCLAREQGKLCADGQWTAASKGGKANLHASDLQLAWLQHWLPAGIESLSGALNATGKVRFGETPRSLIADLNADITPGKLAYALDNGAGEVGHEGGRLTLKVDRGRVDSDLSLSVAKNVVKLQLNAPKLLAGGDIMKTPVGGRVQLNASHFEIVPALVPDIETLDAAIDTDLSIHGSLGKPLLKGGGQIDLRRLSVPVVGVELENSKVDIRARGQKLVFDGKLRSSKGELTLNGDALLDADKHWPLKLALKGKRFRIVNLPDTRVDISPDLRVDRTAEKTQVKGEIKVDKADILLTEIPEGSRSPSDDIVVVRKGESQPPPEPPALPLYADVDVILGKEVHFIGLGLNAFIDGRLRITAKPEEPLKGSGEIRIEQGTFRAYGQNLDIETGIISFPGGPLTKPGVNLRATRSIDNVVVGVSAIGSALKPRITTFSKPAMAERDVISYLLTGSPTSKIGKGTGMLSVGRQINSKLSVSVGTNPSTGDAEIKTNYRINRKLHLQATNGSKSNAFDIFYTFEKE